MQLVRQVRLRRRPWVIATLAYATGIVTWVYLFVTLPRHFVCLGESKADIAKMTVFKLAREAFPQWRAAHRALCPPSIESLMPYMDRDDARDPYGEPYVLLCDPRSGGHLVLSAGEDGKWGTTDDLRSDD